MDFFKPRASVIRGLPPVIQGFLYTPDKRIRDEIESTPADGLLSPELRLSVNTMFTPLGNLDDLVACDA
jgi:hypothetical protein